MKETYRRLSFEQLSISLKYIHRRNTKIETNPRKLTADDSDAFSEKRNYICDILNDKQYLTKSVNILLPIDGEYCLKLRFCSAVMEMETERGDIMKAKAEKIVELFFNNNLFKINSISKRDIELALDNNYHVIFIKNSIINEFIDDDFFMDKIKDVIILKK